MLKEWKSKADWKDRRWEYINAASTDVQKTINRVLLEMEALNPELKKHRDERAIYIKRCMAR